jgi:hypothetical protein
MHLASCILHLALKTKGKLKDIMIMIFSSNFNREGTQESLPMPFSLMSHKILARGEGPKQSQKTGFKSKLSW